MNINIDDLDTLSIEEKSKIIIKLLVDINNNLSILSEKIDRQEEGIEKITDNKNKVYTDEELFILKEQLSWSKLSLRTGIPVSTLQSRCRRYRNSI